jgi:hypothetical protein
MSANEKSFPIYIKTLAGSNKEVNVRANDSVKDLKRIVEAKLSCSVLKLLHRNKELIDESKKLEELKIEKESIVVAIIETEKPSHYFFALDESGSMSGGRWNALMESFVEFIEKQQKIVEESKKTDVMIQDVVSVFFHETRCRFANCKLSDGKVVLFDSIPLSSLKGDSLVNDFRSGGNSFDYALSFIEPHLKKSTAYIPVLLFMTDGGDCGDGDGRPNYRQCAYDHMAQLKKDIPDLRVYVTVVFTNSQEDIDGAKKLCAAAGMDIETHYNYIEDDGSSNTYSSGYGGGGRGGIRSRKVASRSSSSSSSAPPSSSPSPHYSAVAESSAQRKMASHWDRVYCSNSIQSNQM